MIASNFFCLCSPFICLSIVLFLFLIRDVSGVFFLRFPRFPLCAQPHHVSTSPISTQCSDPPEAVHGWQSQWVTQLLGPFSPPNHLPCEEERRCAGPRRFVPFFVTGQKLNKTDGNFWQAVVGGWLLFLFFNRSSFHPKVWPQVGAAWLHFSVFFSLPARGSQDLTQEPVAGQLLTISDISTCSHFFLWDVATFSSKKSETSGGGQRKCSVSPSLPPPILHLERILIRFPSHIPAHFSTFLFIIFDNLNDLIAPFLTLFYQSIPMVGAKTLRGSQCLKQQEDAVFICKIKVS